MRNGGQCSQSRRTNDDVLPAPGQGSLQRARQEGDLGAGNEQRKGLPSIHGELLMKNVWIRGE